MIGQGNVAEGNRAAGIAKDNYGCYCLAYESFRGLIRLISFAKEDYTWGRVASRSDHAA